MGTAGKMALYKQAAAPIGILEKKRACVTAMLYICGIVGAFNLGDLDLDLLLGRGGKWRYMYVVVDGLGAGSIPAKI